MMHVEELRAAREMRLAELQTALAEDSRKIAEALHDVTVETAKFTTKWTYIAAGIAALALLGVYLTYLFPAVGATIGHWLLPSIQGTP